jgi:hypothetical protein
MKYVYILKAGEDHYKVGVSINVSKRLNSIQTGNGHKVYLVATKLCKDYQKVERDLHLRLKAMGSGGGSEWFVLEPEDVIRLCILLNTQPEIDVYANTDLNEQLKEQRIRHKHLEHKLDSILNIVQVKHIKANEFNNGIDSFIHGPNPKLSHAEKSEQEDRVLYEQAIEVVKDAGKASTSLLQRRLRIGYGRAARLIEELEEQSIIGPADGARARSVLVPDTITD